MFCPVKCSVQRLLSKMRKSFQQEVRGDDEGLGDQGGAAERSSGQDANSVAKYANETPEMMPSFLQLFWPADHISFVR